MAVIVVVVIVAIPTDVFAFVFDDNEREELRRGYQIGNGALFPLISERFLGLLPTSVVGL